MTELLYTYEYETSMGGKWFIVARNNDMARAYIEGYNTAIEHTAPFEQRGHTIIKLTNTYTKEVIYEVTNCEKEE